MSMDKWTSVKNALPGINQSVFLYSEETKRVVGPAYIAVHMGSEIKKQTGFEHNLTTGETFNLIEGIGIYALAWCVSGMIFTGFMPTHWAPFPPLPDTQEG
jgi:hypothetical protein